MEIIRGFVLQKYEVPIEDFMKKQQDFPILFILLFVFYAPQLVLVCESKEQGPEWEMRYNTETKSLQPSYIGIVLRLKGTARITQKEGQEGSVLTLESKIRAKDILTTEKNGYVKIKMIDETIMDFAGDSIFKFSQYVYKTQKERFSFYQLIKGKIRTYFSMPAGPDDLKIQAGRVAMGIRGTEILANVQLVENSSKTQIALLSGEVELEMVGEENSPSVKGKKPATYTLKRGALFEAEGQSPVIQGQAFPEISEKELSRYEIKEGNREFDFLPFLEVAEKKQGNEEIVQRPMIMEKRAMKENSAVTTRKNWQELLRENQEEKLRRSKELQLAKKWQEQEKGKGRVFPEKKVPKFSWSVECLEYTYEDIKGRRTPVCSKRQKIKVPMEN